MAAITQLALLAMGIRCSLLQYLLDGGSTDEEAEKETNT